MQEISVSRLKLLALLDKAKELVSFASDSECDELFICLASFCEQAISNKRKAMEAFSQQKLEELTSRSITRPRKRIHMCKCDFFGSSCLEGLNKLQCCGTDNVEGGSGGGAEGGCCKEPHDGCNDCVCYISSLDIGGDQDSLGLWDVWEDP